MMLRVGCAAAARVRPARRGPFGGAAPVVSGWAGRGHGDPDTADGDPRPRADLEELEADGAVASANAVSARPMRRKAHNRI